MSVFVRVQLFLTDENVSCDAEPCATMRDDTELTMASCGMKSTLALTKFSQKAKDKRQYFTRCQNSCSRIRWIQCMTL